MDTSRRRFLFGASATLLATPAIVRVAANLMPVSAKFQFSDLQRYQLEFIEKLAWPPMVVPPCLKMEPASLMPGMITYVNRSRAEIFSFKPAFEILSGSLQRRA